ncbi:MAG: alpha/beta fold hydrolase, partial [Thermodesulfobacteriota bacterium]
GYIDDAVDFIRKRHDIDKVNLMGVCMGGTFNVMYAALHPEKVKNLILTVTPTSFDTDAGMLHVWWGDEGFDVDRLIELHGNMPGDLLNVNFLMLNPARLMIDKYVGFLENMDKKDFLENFVRMEKWIFDSPDVPGETFREFIRLLYQQNRLIQNSLEIGGRHVDLQRVTMPVLNIYARYDHLVPPEACNQLTGNIGSPDAEDFCLDTGHIGIYVSSKSQKVFVPKICEWLQQRDGQPVVASRENAQKSFPHAKRHAAA